MKKTILVILVIVIAVGVYYSHAFNQIDVLVESVLIENIGLSSVSLSLYLRVINPNPLPIPISSTAFNLYINSYYFGQGSSESVTISGNSYRTIHAPITITYSGLGLGAIETLLEGGVAKIEVRGEAYFLIFNVPFQTSNNVTLRY